MAATSTRIPHELLAALESGDLSRDQIELLVQIEAQQLGMTFDEASAAAQNNTLPNDPIGTDIKFLLMLIDDRSFTAI